MISEPHKIRQSHLYKKKKKRYVNHKANLTCIKTGDMSTTKKDSYIRMRID